MKIITGLGNPGEKYKNTRHNVGFLALDFILNDGDGFMEARPSHEFKSEAYIMEKNGQKIVILKPQTYMNDSGLALKLICNFYKVDLVKDVLVIHDEVDLPFATLRQTEGASDAGHNGIKSIIAELGTQNFSRLRVGVESRASRTDLPTDAFVLQNFNDEEMEKLKLEIFPEIKTIVEKFIGLY
jgi:PTH1 family peptidyl-tRNA hydrolase